MTTTKITITGMHCDSCKALLEDISTDTAGVVGAVADIAAGTLTLTHEGTVDLDMLKKEIEADGIYRVMKITS